MKKYKLSLFFGFIMVILLIIIGFLIFTKRLNVNQYFASRYELRGVDVSSYQGEIDWHLLASQNIDFAFIKATEGSTHQDPAEIYA